MDEKTLILIGADGVQRGAIGEVIARFEDKGFQMRGLQLIQGSHLQVPPRTPFDTLPRLTL
jgi:nucleoside diphosphate kinase